MKFLHGFVKIRSFALLTAALVLVCGPPAQRPAFGQQAGAGEQTLSPYFFVNSDGESTDRLPLKSTSATVNISAVIADVTVVQVYRNEGRKPLEAIYVFPASNRAAVHGMKMTIGERTITAHIEKKEDARQLYEKARREGKGASLLEQHRPNVFQMSVANIMPGDEIKTELHYTELLVPSEGTYEFVYPTVIGPRYSNTPASTAPSSEKWSQNPYLHQGEPAPFSFDIKVNLLAGMDIAEMSCPSHKVNISYRTKNNAAVELDGSEKSVGNRDFILKYRLAGNRISSGLLLFEGRDENFFLLTVEPPKRVSLDAVPAREYVFIVDVSGSMHGFPLEISKKLLKDLVSGLRPSDTFNVLLFSGASQLLSERSLPANDHNIRRALDLIEHQTGGGGTELLPALRRALTLPRSEGTSRTFVIATDGYVTVEPEVFDLIRNLIDTANFFPFGIGSSVNRHLIEGMARVGAGEPFVITRPEEAPATAERFRRYIQYPLLTNTTLDFGKFEASEVEPAGVPDLFAERPVIIYGKWKGKPRGVIRLAGISGGHKYEKTIDVSLVKPMAENSALPYLWARSRIASLSDYGSLCGARTGEQITALGLRYGLLTAFTSFVAIDSDVRRKGGDLETVKQPLPLPQGVSDLAVGGKAVRTMAMPAPAQSPAGPFRADRSEMLMKRPLQSPPASGNNFAGKALAHDEAGLARVKIISLSVRGDLSDKIVRQFVEQNLYRLLECLPKGGGKVPAITLTLTWKIVPEGAVADVHATGKGVRAELLECISQRAAGWRFPARPGRREVHVKAVVNLEP